MVGSLGTLGMIATATFRLHPLPEVSETLLIRNQSASDLRNLMTEMKRMQLEAAAVAAIAAGPRFDIAVRFEGFHTGVVEQRERLLRVGAGFSRPGPAESFWRRHDEIRAAGPMRLKIAALPSAIELVMRDVVAPLRGVLSGGGFVWYPTLGLGFLTGATTKDQEIAAAIQTARRSLVLTIEAAPLAVRRLANSWGEPGAALPLMRAMKQRFDPARRLSPGRFVGGI
jgi:glycolate oxidase FAD binding subunit